MTKLLEINGLDLYIKSSSKNIKILDSIHMDIGHRETVAVIGESGSGKSVLAKSILKLHNKEYVKMEGSICIDGKDIMDFSEHQMVGVRGKNVGFVFQEPLSFLDPTMKVGRQITERACLTVTDVLNLMKIEDVQGYMKKYPHQLSGGMAQRGMIAMAACQKPRLLIADEPTSALDVITQSSIMELLKELKQRFQMSILFITHDLKAAADIADRIYVMEKGRIVESGFATDIVEHPKHEYTRRLMDCMVLQREETTQIPGNQSLPRVQVNSTLLSVQGVTKWYEKNNTGRCALQGITLDLCKGETLGILGESGSGKSTLAKIIARAIKPTTGSVLYNNMDIFKMKDYPKVVQMIFQDPLMALNPRMKVMDIVAEGIDIYKLCRGCEREALVRHYLEKVGLHQSFANRYPEQLSGGQRQRVSIARALILKPEVLVCDEPTSYLDTMAQKQILQLLSKLKQELGMSLVFISHDIHVLTYISDRIAVFLSGELVETAAWDTLVSNPANSYTAALMQSYRGPQPVHHAKGRPI